MPKERLGISDWLQIGMFICGGVAYVHSNFATVRELEAYGKRMDTMDEKLTALLKNSGIRWPDGKAPIPSSPSPKDDPESAYGMVLPELTRPLKLDSPKAN